MLRLLALTALLATGCARAFGCTGDPVAAAAFNDERAYVIDMGFGAEGWILVRDGDKYVRTTTLELPCEYALDLMLVGERLYLVCMGEAAQWVDVGKLEGASSVAWHELGADEQPLVPEGTYGHGQPYATRTETMNSWEVELLPPSGDAIVCTGGPKTGWLMNVAVNADGSEFAIVTDRNLFMIEADGRRIRPQAIFARSGKPSSARTRCRRVGRT